MDRSLVGCCAIGSTVEREREEHVIIEQCQLSALDMARGATLLLAARQQNANLIVYNSGELSRFFLCLFSPLVIICSSG